MSRLRFVGSLGAGAAAATLEIQLCKIVQSAKLEWTNFKRRRVGHRSCHSVALVNGDNDGILGVEVVMVLQIVAGLVSALLSISRLTLTGQKIHARAHDYTCTYNT